MIGKIIQNLKDDYTACQAGMITPAGQLEDLYYQDCYYTEREPKKILGLFYRLVDRFTTRFSYRNQVRILGLGDLIWWYQSRLVCHLFGHKCTEYGNPESGRFDLSCNRCGYSISGYW